MSMSSGEKYLIVCSHGNGFDEFRVPEINSIADCFGFRIAYVTAADKPYFVAELPGDAEAHKLASRSISIRSIWRYWAHGRSYDELHERLQHDKPYEGVCGDETRWKFTVGAYGHTIQPAQAREIMEKFVYIGWKGVIDLKNAQLDIGVFEEHARTTPGEPSSLVSVWTGLKIAESRRSEFLTTFNLKKRAFIGNTSMEAEASLYMANQAQAGPGRWVYDPFAGTGSMLVTGAAFGAYAMGSDLDGRQMRGKRETPGIAANAAQYNVEGRIVDCATFDVCQHPFRCGGLFDAIVTDPPYGVRAGAKRLGRKRADKLLDAPREVQRADGKVYSHELDDYVPPTRPFDMPELVTYLMEFALYMLRPGGRLVFFLPIDSEYATMEVPNVPGELELVSVSTQDFGAWCRRLVTMRRVGSGERPVGHVPVTQVYEGVTGTATPLQGDLFDKLHAHVPK